MVVIREEEGWRRGVGTKYTGTRKRLCICVARVGTETGRCMQLVIDYLWANQWHCVAYPIGITLR